MICRFFSFSWFGPLAMLYTNTAAASAAAAAAAAAVAYYFALVVS